LKKFKVLLSETARRQLYELNEKQAEKIKSHLILLSENPFRRRAKADIRKLQGFKNPELYRMRIGDYRAVYTISRDEIKITEIIHRGKGYKWLE
jgi:mRNA interferase RelE/StbE